MGTTAEYSDFTIARVADLEADMFGPECSNPWFTYDSGLTRSNFGFKNVMGKLGFGSIEEIVNRQRASGNPVIGLDLAGQGKVFPELEVAGMACCLAIPDYLIDPDRDKSRPFRKKSESGQSDVAMMAGDLNLPATFDRIKDRLQIEKIPSPNLIFLSRQAE